MGLEVPLRSGKYCRRQQWQDRTAWAGAHSCHSPGDADLIVIAGTPITDDSKSDGVFDRLYAEN
jgi:hypothetical protein